MDMIMKPKQVIYWCNFVTEEEEEEEEEEIHTG
jgi:hypothetical protein